MKSSVFQYALWLISSQKSFDFMWIYYFIISNKCGLYSIYFHLFNTKICDISCFSRPMKLDQVNESSISFYTRKKYKAKTKVKTVINILIINLAQEKFNLTLLWLKWCQLGFLKLIPITDYSNKFTWLTICFFKSLK